MTKNISYHARVERQSRIDYIIDWCKGEFGKPVAIVEDKSETARLVLTEKGILMVHNLETNKLVTMWIATVSQGVAIYSRAFNQPVPKYMMNVFHKNKKAQKNQPQK